MIEVQEREKDDTKVGPYTVMKLGDQTILTLDGVTWEKVEDDFCTCAKFKKTQNCGHLEAMFPNRKHAVPERSKKAPERLKKASASQISKQSDDDVLVYFGTVWWYLRLSIAGLLRALSGVINWIAKKVDPR